MSMTIPIPDTTETSRGARLEARISATQKNVLQRAAALCGVTLSEFVVASAQEAATRVIREHESIVLSHAEQTAFVIALLAPAPPGAELRKAAAAYKRRRARQACRGKRHRSRRI
jgi:uncharacterized protein (DUF1778 family)